MQNDFTKGTDNYPGTRSEVMLLDRYSREVAPTTPSEGTAFAQKGKKNKKSDNKGAESSNGMGKKGEQYDKEYYKDKECFKCGKTGHPKYIARAQAMMHRPSTAKRV